MLALTRISSAIGRNAIRRDSRTRIPRGSIAPAFFALAEKYAKPEVLEAVRQGEGLDDNGDGTGGVEHLDDYWRCEITRKEDFTDLYVNRYYFGCEADDPINAWAFNRKALPMGARLNAFFSSDIGHFDVPDMTEVVPEAYELVEHGLLDDDDFRDFTFANAVRFWGEVNPDFFKGTAVEREAAEVLGKSKPPSSQSETLRVRERVLPQRPETAIAIKLSSYVRTARQSQIFKRAPRTRSRTRYRIAAASTTRYAPAGRRGRTRDRRGPSRRGRRCPRARRGPDHALQR